VSQVIENKSEHPAPGKPDEHGNIVTVTIDGEPKSIQARSYPLDQLKDALGVPADKDLDQVIDGVIHPLSDQKPVKIKGGEQFISHVKTGGSA
jgi:hypothetical protein